MYLLLTVSECLLKLCCLQSLSLSICGSIKKVVIKRERKIKTTTTIIAVITPTTH